MDQMTMYPQRITTAQKSVSHAASDRTLCYAQAKNSCQCARPNVVWNVMLGGVVVDGIW